MRCMARIARTSTHKTRASPATLRMEESREDEGLSVEWCSMVSSLINSFLHSGAAVLCPFFSHRSTMVVTHSIRVQYNDID